MGEELNIRIKAFNKKEKNPVQCDSEIDKGMAKIIEILLDKGVKTYSCCEGHYPDNLPQIILMLEFDCFDFSISRTGSIIRKNKIVIERVFHKKGSIEDDLIEEFFTKEEFEKEK